MNLKQGYNGDLTSRQAGSVGGQMVKKMIEAYENGMKKASKSEKPPITGGFLRLYGQRCKCCGTCEGETPNGVHPPIQSPR